MGAQRSDDRRTRARTVAAVAVAGVMTFTVMGAVIACAPSHQDSNPNAAEAVAELSLGDIPTIRTGADIALPIDEYWVPADDQNLVLRAEEVAMTSCMARFGLEWDVEFHEVTLDRFPHDRLFGIVDLDVAKEYGYHAAGSGTMNPDGTITDPIKEASSVEITEEQDAVASGLTELTEVNGVEIPAGGCIAEARTEVGTQDGFVLELTETTIGYSAIEADKDPRVLKGFDQWSQCMAESGFRYRTPWDAIGDPSWATAEATEGEIAVAVADVECQQKTNLTGLRVAVAAAWQEEYMQDRKEDFVALKERIAQQIAQAKSILAAQG